MEKRALGKLPEEVREPLLEAKRQLRLILRGLIGHVLGEKKKREMKNETKLLFT